MKRSLRLIGLLCLLGMIPGCGMLHPSGLIGESSGLMGSVQTTQERPAPLLPDVTPTMLWGRQQLEPEVQLTYDMVSQAVACRLEEPLEVEADSQELELVLHAIRIDHPEYFWFDGEASFVSTELAGVTVKSSCTFTYTMTREEALAAEAQVQAFTEACLNSPEMAGAETDYDKILGVYRYIINNTDYIITDGDQSILGVMTAHRGTCAGYARSFQYLMNQLGIPCTMALGTVSDGNAHGWNMVLCGGAWYQIDVTWGDPVTKEGQPGTSLQYTYCLVTDEEMYRDHTLDGTLPMPVCTDTTYNYFVREGLQFEQWDELAYETALTESVNRGEPWFSVRFANDEAYQEALGALLGDSRVMEMLVHCGILEENGRKRVSYTQNDLFREISIQLS